MKKLQLELTLRINIPENGLNVNSVFYSVKKIMPKLFFAIVRAIFSAVEERTIRKLKEKFPGRYIRNGHQNNRRHFRASYGVFTYRLAQVRDKMKEKTIVPLMEALSIPPYRRCMKEAMEAGIGLTIRMSYRNATEEVERITGNAIGKSSLHRSLQEFARVQCKIGNLKEVPYRFLMVDGTGVRLQGKETQGTEMRWALASTGENKPFDLVGFWVGESWEFIQQDLKERLNYQGLEVIISDGGPGIEENLLEEGMRHQRCVWHGKRDFPYILYQDGLKKGEQKVFKERLKDIPGLNLRKKDLEAISEEDLPTIKKLIEKTKQGFQDLIEALDPNKYPKARIYIQNLSQHVTTFFEWWIENRKWIPININTIESAFSRVKNRIKFIGKRWSDEGLINWVKVWRMKVFSPEKWDELWKKYLDLNPAFKIEIVKVKYRWI